MRSKQLIFPGNFYKRNKTYCKKMLPASDIKMQIRHGPIKSEMQTAGCSLRLPIAVKYNIIEKQETHDRFETSQTKCIVQKLRGMQNGLQLFPFHQSIIFSTINVSSILQRKRKNIVETELPKISRDQEQKNLIKVNNIMKYK